MNLLDLPTPTLLPTKPVVGRHNIDLAKSMSRVTQGATWKKQRVIVVIPSATTLPAEVALSLWNLVFPPNQGVFRHLALGQEVGEAYSNAINDVLAHPELSGWEYLLTVEHDNIPPADGVLRLIAQMDKHPELTAISGLYWTKGEEGQPQIWGDPNDPVLNFRPQPPIPGELMECNGIGMGFALWRLSMFKDKKLRQPWFKTIADESGVGTQDLYAWGDFRKYGYRCAVDCAVLVGHLDMNTGIIW